jgi:hypothetical protein
MTSDDLLSPLVTFLAQTRELLVLGKAGDWEAFASLLDQRQAGLAALGDNQRLLALARAGQAEEARFLIQQIQEANEQLGKLAEASKEELGEQLRQAVQAQKAVGAYSQT